MIEMLMLGLLAGALLGVPIGPSGALCAYRCFTYGWRSGIQTAVSTIVIGFIFSFFSVLLFITMGDAIMEQSSLANIVSGSVFLIIGFVILISKNKDVTDESPKPRNDFFFFASSLFVAILNPKNYFGYTMFLISFTMIDLSEITISHSFFFATGNMIASIAWWVIVISILMKVTKEAGDKILVIIRTILASAFLVTGLLRLMAE